MQLKFNHDINTKSWQELISTSAFASAFQTSEFYQFFNSVPGFSADAFAIFEQDEIKCLCVVTIQQENGLKAYFSRRAIIYGGPVLKNIELKYLNELLKRISTYYQSKAIYIETRNFHDYSAFKNVFQENGFDYEAYLNYHLNCSDKDTVYKNLNTNRKRQIKKAYEKGVSVVEAENEQDVKDYYDILSELYRTKIKKPLFPISFFMAFLKSKVGKILLVKVNNTIIGGIVCPILLGKCIYELYICGLDAEYKECSPSVMATYAAIEYGYKHQLTRFDFMGAGKPTEDYGVRDFKAKFGGELVEHGRFIKIQNKILYNIGKLALATIKKLKA
jgi:serine/alanine adding enzyme